MQSNKTGSKSLRHSVLRRGLTLVELLVTISLITIVSSMFMVAYRSAATEAANIRTQSTIRKVSEVLNSRIQEYENYSVGFTFPQPPLQMIPFSSPLPGDAVEFLAPNQPGFEPKGILLERVRLMAIREIMTQEMPDNVDDIKPSPAFPASSTKNYWTGLKARNPVDNSVAPVFVSTRQTTRAARINQKLTQVDLNWRSNAKIVGTNFNAELLYMIIEDSSFNGSSALELFGRTEIGDKDGDTLNEILDAYGEPIQWLRWPTGFPGSTRMHPDLLDPSFNIEGFASSVFGDPLDRRRADPGYRIPVNGDNSAIYKPDAMAFPLVISKGPDKQFGVRFAIDPAGTAQGNYLALSTSVADVQMPVPYNSAGVELVMADPWFPRGVVNKPLRVGSILNPKFFEDDITNYSINGASQ